MIEYNLYDMTFKRKSIRKYDLNPIEDRVIGEIGEFIDSLKPLYDNIKTEIKIIKRDNLSVLLPVKAPHYLLMTSENKEGYLTNAGFMLEQIDLFLSSIGIGSCYLGMAQPTKATKKGSELEFVMVLALGNSAEVIHRVEVKEFKRKSISQITNCIGMDNLLEPARLAPSATNSQPWYFTGEGEVIHLYCLKLNIVKVLIYEKMNKIDMGIALCHIWVAAKHFGKDLEFSKNKTAQENPPKGYYYNSTITIK